MTKYAPPITFENNEDAKRYMMYLAQTNDSIRLSKKDYSIWRLGEYDPKTGEIHLDKEKTLILRAESVADNG